MGSQDESAKLQHAIALLNNHINRWGDRPFGGSDNEEWKGEPPTLMESVPAQVRIALEEALVAAARYATRAFSRHEPTTEDDPASPNGYLAESATLPEATPCRTN